MATEQEEKRQVRISRVAGRFLVFDIEDVMYIRRHHGLCAVLTGTMPQNPTQNLFLGLPVELRSEEARLLLDNGAAYIADETAVHTAQLGSMDEATRKAYVESLKQQRRTAQRAFDEEKARIKAEHQGKRQPKKAKAPKVEAETESDSLFDSTSPAATPAPVVKEKEILPAITPTTSSDLLSSTTAPSDDLPAPSAFYRYLNSRGFFTTPGLRFGGDYSVYPGDPFRYHAHYLANSYGWDDEIPMLDIVTSGRLGTAVKKSFMFGAEKSGGSDPEENVRMFCVEWAGM
ncbi:putative tRNA-splicing endonuclease subunit tsp-4 [Podospora australis]|uniref:tRNA-splicing endonuclease subunit Sen34 n=1 Tax=Podospora australis TaxID=1536484 RepID=A0AAN6X4P4_9PEZI|nr:putative tRNA-splicing endonuclease subunit tsp-4 [Podospora australis]